MERRQRNQLLVTGLVVATAGSFVALVFIAMWIGNRPGFGLVPLILFVGWLFLARHLMGVAERRRAENPGRYPPRPTSKGSPTAAR
jgi:UPF0716 family protein affecting phage T7 exclusion